ncbi:MAG: VWA domain-containing protein [Planctomycetaceae bacterium]|nr:VWA domain-containing protein [Planctomycetaceae bacterium]
MFRFQSYYLLLLVISLMFLLIARLRQRVDDVLFGDLRRGSYVPKTLRQRLLFIPPCLLYFALLLLIIAIARPQDGRDEYRVRHDGIAIAFCLDKSDSMKAVDFQIDGKRVDSLEAAKQTFRDFVVDNGKKLTGRPDDMIAVLAFGGYVDTCCPLTSDHQTLISLLDSIQLPQPLFDNRNQVMRLFLRAYICY